MILRSEAVREQVGGKLEGTALAIYLTAVYPSVRYGAAAAAAAVIFNLKTKWHTFVCLHGRNRASLVSHIDTVSCLWFAARAVVIRPTYERRGDG